MRLLLACRVCRRRILRQGDGNNPLVYMRPLHAQSLYLTTTKSDGATSATFQRASVTAMASIWTRLLFIAHVFACAAATSIRLPEHLSSRTPDIVGTPENNV